MYRFVSYLDALSPGMKAKLDPNFRLAKPQEPVYAVPFPQKGAEFPSSSHTPPPIAKRRTN